jgi:hypothetical protein
VTSDGDLAMSVVERVLERLERVQKDGSGWAARSPAHRDRQASRVSVTALADPRPSSAWSHARAER